MISGGNLFNIRLYKWRIFRPTYIVAELLVKKYQKWLTFRQQVKQEYVWRDVTTHLLHCKHIIASPRERHYRTPGACEIHVQCTSIASVGSLTTECILSEVSSDQPPVVNVILTALSLILEKSTYLEVFTCRYCNVSVMLQSFGSEFQ